MPISGSRLDLLMNLTGTSNGELGKALNFDTSYVSRIRAGKRGIPRHQPFVEPAAMYFAEKLSEDALPKSVAAFLISPDTPWPADRETAAARIAGWLRFDIGDGNKTVENFLRVFSAVQIPTDTAVDGPLELPKSETTGFIGNEGKRQAMDLLLNDLVTQNEDPGQLLFYSDEDPNWLTEDPVFFENWKQKVLRYLLNGGKICLIHTAKRELSEVFTEIEFYMPFYLCGNVEPYYCPVLLDGIFRRTMCILPGRHALAGQSIGEDTARSTSFLIANPETLRAMEYDYRRFLSMCRPIMHIMDPARPGEVDRMHGMFTRNSRMIHAGRTSMLSTLPESALKSLEQRIGDGLHIRQIRRSRNELIKYLDEGVTVTEILNFPEAEAIRREESPMLFSVALGCSGVKYTAAEYRLQLINVMQLLERYPNYHVITAAGLPENVDTLASEEAAILVRTDEGGKAFFFPMNRAVTALWKYLDEFAARENREKTFRTLNELIFALGCG